MKKLFQQLVGGSSASPATAQLTLAAFGKHPGWADHIAGINLVTDSLANLKQVLYVDGIGGQIDSGAWEKLDPAMRVEGFDHTFLWLQPGRISYGQLWSSTDSKGRAKYPMVLCAEIVGAGPDFILARARPELDQLRRACLKTNSPAEVEAECQAAQGRLRGWLGMPAEMAAIHSIEPQTRRHFVDHPDLGPARQGLLRVLHELGPEPGGSGSGRSADTSFVRNFRSRCLRVPLVGRASDAALLLWTEFFRTALPERISIFIASRVGANWLDVIVGEPTAADFFFFQASPKAQPFTTDIPYELPPELQERLGRIMAEFAGAEAVASALAPVAPTAESPRPTPAPVNRPQPPTIPAPAPVPATAPPPPIQPVPPGAEQPTEPSPAKPRNGSGLIIWAGGGGALLVLVILAFVLMPGKKKPDTASSQPLAAAKPSPLQSPPPGTAAQPNPSPATGPKTLPATTPAKTVAPQVQSSSVVDDISRKFALATNGAVLAFRSNDFPAALNFVNEALRLQPGNVEANNLGRVIREKHDSLQIVASAVAAAQTAFNNGHYEDAIKQAQAALAAEPANAPAKNLLAQAQDAKAKQRAFDAAMLAARQAFAKGDFEDCVKQLNSALQWRQADPDAVALLAQVQQAKSTQTESAAALAAAQAAFAAGRMDEAKAQANKVRAGTPSSQSASELLARINSETDRTQKFSQAISAAEQALNKTNLTEVQRQLNIANQIKPQASETADLQKKLQAALKVRDTDADFERIMSAGEAALNKGDFDEASRQAQLAAQLKPGNVFASALMKSAQDGKPKAGAAKTTTASVALSPTGPVKAFTNGLGMEFIWIPMGTTGGVYVGKYEVTRKQFRDVMGTVPDQKDATDDLPVANVSFRDASDFCQKLVQKEHRKYALPTKKQWVFAAQLSGVEEASVWGLFTNNQLANVTIANEVTSWDRTECYPLPAPGGSRGPQANGLCDVLGNVREWTSEGDSAGFSYNSQGHGSEKSLFVQGKFQLITGLRCILMDGP